MAFTKRSDIIFVDQLQEAVQAAFPGRVALYGTGAAVLNTTLPSIGNNGAKLKGGDTIRVPYWNAIGEFEDPPEGGALTPQKVSESSETSTVVWSGSAGEIGNWAQITAQFSDPYAELARQILATWIRRIDKGLIVKAATTTLLNDISGLSGGASQISWDEVVNTRGLFQDEQDGIALMVVHSKVYQDMFKLKTTTGLPLLIEPTVIYGDKDANGSKDDGSISVLPRFAGIPVRVSNRIAQPSAGVYDNLICKVGSLAAWVNSSPEIKADEDILANSEITALHTYHVEHLYKRLPGSTLPGVAKLRCKAST